MAKEILAIPEEHLAEVIKVIREGLKHLPEISDETRTQLSRWCHEEENYLSEWR